MWRRPARHLGVLCILFCRRQSGASAANPLGAYDADCSPAVSAARVSRARHLGGAPFPNSLARAKSGKIMGIDPTVATTSKLLGHVAWLAASSRFPRSQGI